MTLFLLVLLLMGAYFVGAVLVAVLFCACWFWVQDRRRAAMLDRAAVAAEWEDRELLDEWTRIIDTLSPLAFISADDLEERR